MAITLLSLLEGNKASNGTKALLEQIRSHQADMPEEVRDDLTFGALVVVFDMGVQRAKRLAALEKCMMFYGGVLILVFLTIVALHGDVPWLTQLAGNIFSP